VRLKEKVKDGFNVGLRHSQSNQEIATNGIGTIGHFAPQQFKAAHSPFRVKSSHPSNFGFESALPPRADMARQPDV
jgi:hypothetical protein